MAGSGADLAMILRVAEENTAALKRVQADVTNLGNAANNAGPSFVKLSGSIAVGTVAAQAAIGVIGGLSNAFLGAVKGAVDLSSNLEQTRIGLTSMLGSGQAANKMLGDLQAFAEKTNFQFPGLADGAKRMLAMGFASQDVIPLLGSVANAVGAVGGGQEAINRVTLALGQMQAKGKLATEEMNQLAELGIPVWKILSEAIGKTQAETIALVQSGGVASATFIAAFHKFAQEKWGDVQAEQARTFSGAMSNVQDVLGRLSVTGFQALFDALTNGANVLFNFLKSDRVTQWALNFNASIGAVLTALVPLGNVLKSILGIGGGGTEAAAAAEKVAAPALSITAAVTAGADKSKAAIQALDVEAHGIDQTIHGINAEMEALNEQSAALKFQTEDTKKEFEAQLEPLKSVHDELQNAARDAKEGFDQFLIPLKSSIEGIKQQITDTKQGYADQIDVVKDQIDALQGVNDTLRKQQDIQQDIEDLELRRKGLLAQGDPVKKADLQNKLDDIGFDKDHISNQIQLLSLHNKKGEKDKEIANLRKEQNKLDAEAIGVREKMAGLVDRVATAEVKRAQALEAVQKAEQAIARKKEDVGIKEQIDPLKQKVKDLESARDAAIAPLEANAKAMQTMYDRLKQSQEEALTAIERKQRDNEKAIQDTEKAQTAALKPLQEQADVLERQRSELQLSAQHWQNIKQTISDSKKELEDANKAAKGAGLTQGAPVKAGGSDKKEILDPRDSGIVPPAFNVGKPLISKEAIENIRQAAVATGELAKNMNTLGDQLKPIVPLLLTIGAGLVIVEGFTKFGLVLAAVIGWGAQFVTGMTFIGQALVSVGAAFAAVGLGTAAAVAAIGAFVVSLGLYITNFGGFRDATNRIFGEVLELVKQVFIDIGENIRGAFALMAKDSREGGSNFFPAMKTGLDSFTTGLVTWLGTQTAAFGTWISGMITWFEAQGAEGSALLLSVMNLGTSIVNAIGKGIGDTMAEGGEFAKWLKENFVDKLPAWVKEWLKIESPSGVFREIGGQMVAGLQKGITEKFPDAKNAFKDMMGGLTGIIGGGDVSGNAAEWLKTALGITQTPMDWFGDLYELMKMESGGYPKAQNPTHVIRDGVDYGQATGLMQMLPSTFRSHMLDELDDIWNPIHNAVSAIRYIKDTYGSVHNINRSPEGGYEGYAKGGILPNNGLYYGHKDEVVLNRTQQQRLLSGGAGGGTTVIVNVAGSVTSEQDLVECIRRGLIQTARRNGFSALGGYA